MVTVSVIRLGGNMRTEVPCYADLGEYSNRLKCLGSKDGLKVCKDVYIYMAPNPPRRLSMAEQ